MATWKKEELARENGEIVPMQVPEIISASRSTDIPAFYADWFFARLEKGYSAWTNPFNGVRSYVSYKNTRFIVFWSKNPRPLLPHLDYLKERVWRKVSPKWKSALIPSNVLSMLWGMVMSSGVLTRYFLLKTSVKTTCWPRLKISEGS